MKTSPRLHARRPRGYILFELVIALTIFSVGILQMSRHLNDVVGVAKSFNQDQVVRLGMRSFLEEIRKKPITEISLTQTDIMTGITYTSTTEPVSLKTSRGGILLAPSSVSLIHPWPRHLKSTSAMPENPHSCRGIDATAHRW